MACVIVDFGKNLWKNSMYYFITWTYSILKLVTIKPTSTVIVSKVSWNGAMVVFVLVSHKHCDVFIDFVGS